MLKFIKDLIIKIIVFGLSIMFFGMIIIIGQIAFKLIDNISAEKIPIEDLMINPKENYFIYVLNGETHQINFTFYKGLNDYLKGLSRTIESYLWETVTSKDFILRDLNNEYQNKLLKPFIDYIKNMSLNDDDKVRLVVSLVQNIPYDYEILESDDDKGKYPYEVMYTQSGVCAGKSELLVYFLRELGYGTAIFRFYPENHDAVGIKCLLEYSYKNSGYCFIETTTPTIITDSTRDYVNVGKLYSDPEIIIISEGYYFNSVSKEYNDKKKYIELEYFFLENLKSYDLDKYKLWIDLRKKYGLEQKECLDSNLCNGECWNICPKGFYFFCDSKKGGICKN